MEQCADGDWPAVLAVLNTCPSTCALNWFRSLLSSWARVLIELWGMKEMCRNFEMQRLYTQAIVHVAPVLMAANCSILEAKLILYCLQVGGDVGHTDECAEGVRQFGRGRVEQRGCRRSRINEALLEVWRRRSTGRLRGDSTRQLARLRTRSKLERQRKRRCKTCRIPLATFLMPRVRRSVARRADSIANRAAPESAVQRSGVILGWHASGYHST